MIEQIKNAALSVGFDACGFARAEALTEDAAFLRMWLDEGKNGEMHYLNRNFEKRTDPRLLVPGCKSIVVVLLNYFPEKPQNKDLPRIARYAFSQTDYHFVIKEKLAKLEQLICKITGKEHIAPGFQHQFVDSAPVLERRWAQKAGLGWIGKHTLLINPEFGSWSFIGVLMLDFELSGYNSPVPDRCGNCTRCIDNCPTGALSAGILDARKCISYLTIEHKSDIPQNLKDKLSGWKVGCDICQEVCPWNQKKAIPNLHPELKPTEEIFSWTDSDWQSADKESIQRIFGKSALMRALNK